MRNAHPGKNQEAAIVGDFVKMLLSDVRLPTDEAVTGLELPDTRFPSQRSHGAALVGGDDVFQLCSNESVITEVVMAFHYFVPKGLLLRL